MKKVVNSVVTNTFADGTFETRFAGKDPQGKWLHGPGKDVLSEADMRQAEDVGRKVSENLRKRKRNG